MKTPIQSTGQNFADGSGTRPEWMTHSIDDAEDWQRMFPDGVWNRRVETIVAVVSEPPSVGVCVDLELPPRVGPLLPSVGVVGVEQPARSAARTITNQVACRVG